MTKVYIKFPKTGLGNMMLVWARGVVFARINNIEEATSSWWGLHWGALLRSEQRNRLYWNYFIESSLVKRILFKIYIILLPVEQDPPIIKCRQLPDKKIFIFNKVVRDNDLFNDIRNYKDLINAELNKILHPQLELKLQQYSSPVISIHIRRGDFTLGNQTTSLSHFINGINLVREVLNYNLPVTVFSDAEKEEIADIFNLPEVFPAEKKPDILDILLMSKSKVLMLSQSSTFSYWGAFLSDAIVIIPKNDWQKKIRSSIEGQNYKEIKWDGNDINSTNQLKEAIALMKI
ncbi:MAG: alpha-1,2-fucosyltransferase [Chitinophagaceae bacterium]